MKSEYKKILVLKDNSNDFEQFFTKMMNKLGTKTCSVYRDCNKIEKFCRRVHFKLDLPFKSIWYAEWKHNVEKYDYIIIFDFILDKDIINFVEKKNAKGRIIFWYWNTIVGKKPNIYKSKRCEFWSFDQNDCKKYNLKWNNQFYFKDVLCNKEYKVKKDIMFVGVDKGRLRTILQLTKRFKEKNISTDFTIIYDRFYNIIELDEMVTRKSMQYDEIIKKIKESKAILDIVKDGQEGLTLRVLESIFYSKKLITNNKTIKDYDFYNKNNIFVIEDDDIDKIDEFLSLPYVGISRDIIDKYTYETWLNNFITNKITKFN